MNRHDQGKQAGALLDLRSWGSVKLHVHIRTVACLIAGAVVIAGVLPDRERRTENVPVRFAPGRPGGGTASLPSAPRAR
jgi:hypothetical protein